MGESLRSLGAITLWVEDPQRSKEFYTRAFDVEVAFEDADSVAIQFDNMFLNLLRRGAAVWELLGPVEAAKPDVGVSFEMTVWVEDCDAVCADLVERGVVIVSGPSDRQWGMRTAAFLDPDGYIWEVSASITDD